MRQLKPHETAKKFDWFYGFGGYGWVQLEADSMPLYRHSLKELDRENKAPHYPLIIVRPTERERKEGKKPNWKPKGKLKLRHY